MRLSRERVLADAAATRVFAQREKVSGHLQTIQHRVMPWRPALIIGSGLIGGYLLGQRQIARLARGATSLASMGIALMRTPIGPLAIAMLRGTSDPSTRARRQDTHKNHPMPSARSEQSDWQ